MEFTSPTEIVRKWTTAFTEHDEMIILKNNKFLGLYLWGELGKAVQESWIITQIREELWELNDQKTGESIVSYRAWERSESITLDDFRKKYEI
jgi:hypothetical protein